MNRLVVTAGPGEGKTSLLRRILRTYPVGGSIFDPLGELSEAGLRWARYDYWRYLPRAPEEGQPDLEGYGTFIDRLNDISTGEALIIDEAARFMPAGSGRDNPVIQWADTARNRGAKFVFAEKRPTRMESLIVDLSDVLVFRPWKSAAANRWLASAEVDLEQVHPLENLGRSDGNPWYILQVGGEVALTTAGEIADRFESLDNVYR